MTLGSASAFASLVARVILYMLIAFVVAVCAVPSGFATPYTETVPNGNGAIPNTYPPVGGTMFVLIGANGNIYYQFVNPSTQFEGFQFTGNPVAFRGNPFQLGPAQTLNCGPTACIDYFGGSIVEGYARLTARDGDACPGNFDFNDVFFEVNGIRVGSFSGRPANTVERTSRDGLTSIGFEDCFRNQGSNETSTAWFDLTPVPGLLNNILTVGSTTPFVFDDDGSSNRGDNFWFFRDGNDATGTPEVAPGIEIIKTADVTEYSAPGDIINYSFEVTNIGSVLLNNVTVTDTFITGAISCPLTSLASAQSMICTGQHIVSQANVDNDIVFVNTAEVSANPTEGTLGSVSGTITIPGPAANNSATITKTPSITSGADVGDTITYTYVVTNTGNITLDDVSVADAHNGVGALSAVANEALTNTSGLSIETTANDGVIDSLTPGDSVTFQATYLVEQGDVDAQTDITNLATVVATPNRGSFVAPSDNASVGVVTAAPGLSIDKSTLVTEFTLAGEVINYSYLVTNTGNVSVTSPITVADDLINAAGGSVSCPGLPVGGLAPGASLTCSGNYTVTQADVDAGSITNIASASDGTTTSPTDTVTVNGTQAPELTLDKRLQSGSPTAYTAVGDTLLYEYEVRNTGNTTITAAISVADDVIDGSGGSVSCPALPAGGLVPNASITCTASYSVEQGDIDAGSVTNTASATDGAVTSAPDAVTVNAVQSPAMEVTKTAQPFPASSFIVGATVTYDYVVENTGNTTITDPITVSDNRIPSVTCDPLPAGGLLPNDTLVCTGSYVVETDDVALGSVTNLATATDGTTTSPQTSETIPSGANPALGLTKTADAPATFSAVGDVIDYTFEVTNTGNVSFARDITVVDALIPGSPIVCFTSTPANPDLIPGESISCSGSYTVTQADLDAGEVFNEATANTIFSVATPVVSDPATETVPGNITPSLDVVKSATPSTFTAAGESLSYTIAVENDGNQTLTNINVSDPLIPSLMCNIPTLAPGATDNSCVGTYTVTQADVDAGVITNVASATGTDPQGGSVTDTGTIDTNGPAPAPSVEIVKTASPSPFGPAGSIVAYNFEVRNTGNVTLNAISVTDPLIPAFVCNIPTLLPGASDTTSCAANYTVDQDDIDTGSITNEASAQATSADPSGQSVSDSDQITTNGPAQNPELALEKVGDISGLSVPPQVGDEITYTFRVENTGNVTLTNVDVTDPDAVVSGDPIASLAPGAVDTTTFTAIRVLTQDDINAGSFTNQATVTGTPPGGGAPITDLSDDPAALPGEDDPTVVTIPQVPAIELTKSSVFDDGGDGIANVGDQINYTFRVENTGNVTLTNIAVSDPGAIVSGGPIPSLAPGESDIVTFTAAIQVTQADIDAGSYSNQATASGTPPDGGTPVTDLSDDPANPASDDDPTVTPLPQAPGLDMVKTATNVVFTLPGDVSTFEYVVTNTGNTTIVQPISVTDNLIPSVSCPALPAGGLAPGASLTCTGDYPATQQDLDNGSVTNIATATDGNVTSPVAQETIPATQDPALEISKSSPDTTYAAVGDILNYTFELTNSGNLTLTGTTQVVDDRIGTIDCFTGNFVPGSTQTCTATYSVTQNDLDTGFVTNQAFGQNDTIVSPPDSVTINATQSPSLAIDKSSTDTTFTAVGDVLTYSYLVTNNGNVTITTPISVADDRINGAGDLVSCPALPAGGLAPTSSITCTGTYSVTQNDLNSGDVTNIATASDGTTTSPGDTVTINATQLPELSLEKEGTVNDGGDGSVDEGDTIEYTFRVENTGNVTLTNVTLDDPDAVVTGGPIVTLVPGAVDTVTFTAVRTLTQQDIDNGSFSNQATVTGTPPGGAAPVSDLSDDPNNPASGDDPTVVTLPARPSIALEKVGDASGFSTPPVVGNTITYTFRIENTGNVTLNNITLSDPGVVVSGGPIVSLDPGDVDAITFTAERTLTQDDINAGSFSNQASVSATPPGGGAPITDLSDDPADPASADDPTVTPIQQAPSIDMVKTATNVVFTLPGDVSTFEYVVTNTGNTSIVQPISVTDNLIPSVSCPALPAGGLLPGASLTCTGSYPATQQDLDNGSVTNIATATDGITTTPVASETIPANQNPALTIAKTSPDTTYAAVGDILNYTFELTNSGNLTLTGITQVVDDRIGTIDCFVGNFVPGSTQSCTATYSVTQSDLDDGFVTNQAFGQNGTVVSPPDSVTINATQSPSLAIDKSSTDTTFSAVGDILTYSYQVTNDGNVTITSPISVADDRIDAAGGSVSCPLLPAGGLAPNASLTCTGTYAVTQNDLNTGAVTNTATASDGTTTSPSDAVTINGTQLPALALEKAGIVNDGGDGSVDEDDTIEYTFRVENTGNVTLSNVTVDDPNAVVSGGPILALVPGAVDTVTFTAVRVLTQNDINNGSFSNQATVTGTPPGGGAPVSDLSDDPNDPASGDDPTVVTIPATPSIALEKVDDISGFSSPPVAGDIISYTFRVENTGNVTLNNITLSDPGVVVSGGPIISLDPGEVDTATFTATRELSQDNINVGWYSNQATVTSTPPNGGAPVSDLSDDPADPTSADDPTITQIPQSPALNLEKRVASFTQVFPLVYDIEYTIDITNTGNVTANTIQVTDDLAAALAPGSVVSTNVSIAGFGGNAASNTSYDGISNVDLLQGVSILPTGETGTITLVVRADFASGFPAQPNTAFGTADEVPSPVPSNDPSVTPGDPSDVNPTPSPLADLDGDGSPDNIESATADRDGDGISDAEDFDPTGYFYCQETARILTGGFITVSGPLGTQSGIGTSNNITIVQDGSNGFYQFFVSAPGRYTLNLTYPSSGVASQDRLAQPTLDVTSLLPSNPGVLGAGEFGATGELSDGSQAANPFHLEFDIEAGDPPVFNNNIPLQFCGAPEVTASKSVQGTPVILGNGSTEVVFRLSSENTSTTRVDDVSLIDDLDAVFGAGNYSVTNLALASAPTGFGATVSSAFNGGSDTNTLSLGGDLLPGERVDVDLTVEVMPAASGDFTNSVTAGGVSPLDGSPIPSNSATTDVSIAAAGDVNQLQVEKIAGRSVVRLGEILPYTITVRNPEGLSRVGVNIVDFLPAGLTYRPGSAAIDGTASDPLVSGRRLVFEGQTIPANGSVTVTFNVGVSAAASALEFENRAWVEDPATGNRISNIAIATVRRQIEHVFDCGEIIGKVFDDQNNNGYQDEGEPGLPGVRVATVKGELITTDKHGRYHVPCASIPDADIGSNFILKLDERTLPTGYRITTENPRVVRLTRGKLTKLNFGASISRVVRLDLNGAAFKGASPSSALDKALPKLIDHLKQEISVLRLSYQSSEVEKRVARERMRNLRREIENRWKRGGKPYDLQIETRIVAKN